MNSGVKSLVFLLALAAASGAQAFQPVPKASGKALGVTRGKAFSSGVVFVNGKYLAPPYVIERWGTGIRINNVPVSGQIVDWNEFLKTQSGVRAVPVEPPAAEDAKGAAEPKAAPSAASAEAVKVSAQSLDDLFDEDPEPAKDEAKAEPQKAEPPAAAPAKPEAPKRATRMTYVLTGDFVPNDASKDLLGRINASRTRIDRLLRSGGFACFGDGYSAVMGDSRSLLKMLEALPGLMQDSVSEAAFCAGVRRAGLVFLDDALCKDLYRNRQDGPKLKRRCERLQMNQKWDKVMERASDPLF